MMPLPPASIIGILGGGQLGRMLAVAAARLGFKVHIFCPDQGAPAFEVAKYATIASYDDEQALRRFALSCDVVTLEFENIPLAAVDLIASLKPFHPARRALEVSQDRYVEKNFLGKLGIDVANWWKIDNREDLVAACGACDQPLILKTRSLGYDGKGQMVIKHQQDIEAAFKHLGGQPAIAEKMIAFKQEISVILVRDGKGRTISYDIGKNDHQGGILRCSTIPAILPAPTQQKAVNIAATIASALDYKGVLAVEFFVTDGADGPALIVNEFAPRVHNTGHWTMDACLVDQFENHIRAVADWPLGLTGRYFDARMTNLLGEMVDDWLSFAQSPDTVLHIYGKDGAKKGRKLGHITRLSDKSS